MSPIRRKGNEALIAAYTRINRLLIDVQPIRACSLHQRSSKYFGSLYDRLIIILFHNSKDLIY